MSYTPPAGNAVALPIGGELSYSPPAGNAVPLPLEDDHPAPNAISDFYAIALNTARTVPAPGVLSNDALYSGVLSSNTSPSHGTLTLNADGSFTYTPASGYTGNDSFTYTLGNDNGFGTATVSLTIYAAPVTIGHTWYVTANTPLTVAAPGVLNGCAVNGATITAHTSPAHGTLTLAPDGSFTYTPTSGFTGSDSFTFTLSNYAGSSTSTITLIVEFPPTAISDAYSTPYGQTLNVAAPGPLYNDDIEGAVVTLGTSTSHGSLTFNADGSFVYVPGATYSGNDSFTYVLTNDVGTSTGTVTIIVQALPATIRYIRTSTRGAWGVVARETRRVSTSWSAPPQRVKRETTAWGDAPARAVRTSSSFGEIPRRPVKTVAPWQRSPEKQASVGGGFRLVPRRASRSAAPWAWLPQLHHNAGSGWQLPPRRTTHPRALAGWLPRAEIHPIGYYLFAPQRTRKRFLVPWGLDPRVVWTPRPSPGVQPPPIIEPPPVYIPPNGANVALPLECLWYDDPGNEIAIPFGPFACYASSLGRRRYIVLNTAALVRLPERTPIPFSAIKFSPNVDDSAWPIAITLTDPAFKSYLLPDSDGPKSVELNVNGWVMTAIIDLWSTQTQFPGDTVTLNGHSRTMLLNAPFRMPRDYAQAADRLAQQLIDDELQFSGFTSDYGALNWLVPGGVWTYQQQTPLAAIRTIAAASGGVALPHLYEDVLQIRPRWPANPWDWPTTSPDKIVQDDFTPQWTGTDQVSGMATYTITGLPLWPATATDKPGLLLPLQLVQFVAANGWKGQVASVDINIQMQSAGNGVMTLVVTQDVQLQAPPAEPIFDYVLVSGQQIGVSDPIIRTGRAGTARLPQIVDALVVTDQVALERGRNAIAGGGDTAARVNIWQALTGILPGSRYIKGNVTAINGDGSITVATSDGGTIRARPLPGQSWTVGAGVFVQDGRIVDVAPNLPGTTQYV